jgi:hypothetical protein
MKHVTSYNLFESESEPIRTVFTKEQLNWLDKCTENSWKYNPSTGLVDINGDFYCSGQNLQDFKGVRFGTVGRGFSCKNNQLTTLVGAPQSVGGDFNCHNNQLTTLVGAPQSVGDGFLCSGNPVTESTLESIFALMKKGKPYQQALEQRWPKMTDGDRVLMYKDHPSLSPEETRKYKALAAYNNIKDYI